MSDNDNKSVLVEHVGKEKLQALQEELARTYNVAIAIRDCGGELITNPSQSADPSSRLFGPARDGLRDCLVSDLKVTKDDLSRGIKVYATLFSGGVATVAIPILRDSELLGVIHLARILGDVRPQLERLHEFAQKSPKSVPASEFMDEVAVEIEEDFVSTSKAVELAVRELLFGETAGEFAAPVHPTDLPDSINLLPGFLEHLPLGVFFTAKDWVLYDLNQKFVDILDYPNKSKVVGLNFLSDICDVESLPLVEEIKGGEYLRERPARFRGFDGADVPVRLTIMQAKDNSGEFIGYRGFVTELKEVASRGKDEEKGGELEEQKRRALINAWPEAAVVIDSECRILSLNVTAERAIGSSGEGLLGESVVMILPDQQEKLEERLAQLKTGFGAGTELSALRLDLRANESTTLPFECITAVLSDDPREVALFFRRTAPSEDMADKRLVSAERVHTRFFDALPVGIVVIDQDMRITQINEAACRTVGYAKELLVGRGFGEILAGDHRDRLSNWMKEVLKTGPTKGLALKLQHKNGSQISAVGNFVLLRDESKKRANFLLSLSTTAEDSVLVAELSEIRRQYRQLVETSRDLYWAIEITDVENFELATPLEVSRGFADIKDVQSLEKEGGMLRLKVTHTEESWATFRKACLAVYTTQRVLSDVRTTHVDSDGEILQIFNHEIFPLYRTGKLIGVQGLARDITHEFTLQKELQRSEEKYRALVENSATGIGRVSPDGKVLDINPAGLEILGCDSIEELNEIGLAALFGETETDTLFAELREKSEVKSREVGLKRSDGKKVELLLSASRITKSGRPPWVELVFEDITPRERAVKRLRDSEDRFRSFAESIQEGVAITTAKGRFAYVNQKLTEMFGYIHKELDRMTLFDLIQPQDRKSAAELYARLMQGDDVASEHEFRGRKKDGTVLQLEISITPRRKNGKVVGASVVMRDVGLQRSLEEQLQQAQKMESVGALAGGLAHDFNNILTEIMGYASLLQAEEEMPAHTRGMIAQIQEQAALAGNLTQQLLTFSRYSRPQKRPMQLNEIILEAARFLSHSLPDGVLLKTHLAGELHPISGDPVQLQQVIMNLCINARDAMPEGGKIIIRTENFSLTPEQRKTLQNQSLEEVVRIRVADNGIGMDEETQKKIFQPFFTTKSEGKGSGLGLSTVFLIVNGHGGEIRVSSEPRKGTTFDIYLPALIGLEEKADDKDLSDLQGGNERILLVDDEEEILALGKEMLEKFGYEVLTAESGDQALRVFGERASSIDLVIIDLLMPGLEGGECAAKLREIDPGVIILISSGYLLGPREKVELKEVADEFLQKPFDLRQLLTLVRSSIDRGRD